MLNQLDILFYGIIFLGIFSSVQAIAQDQTAAEFAREKASQADASALAADEWKRAEKSMAKATRLAEKSDNAEKIATSFEDAIEDYDAAELEAINVSLLDPARRALRAADDVRAKRYAPVTYAGAVSALEAAETLLTEDRHATEDINVLVEQARFEADYAARVASMVAEKPDTESLIRDRDYYLFVIAEAAGAELRLDENIEVAVKELEATIHNLYAEEQRLRSDLTDSQAFVAALEDEIRDLDTELGGASAERRQLVIQIESQARTEEKFLQTEAMFNESEADVLRQSDAIVIRLFGLEFESGSAELNPGNGPLLEKVAKAIDIYPGATIVVEGHTDSQGSSRLNQLLSQNRAETVVAYMMEKMRVAPHLVDAIGYGASRPIANNETEEGRAKNRRIDLVIRPAG
jgi:outer membrane protein OmpA-like peptidoglycan-associated protein